MAADRSQQGSSLIEVMVALLLLSFALLGILSLQAKSHSVSQNAEETNRASLLASEFAASLIATQTNSGTLVPPDLAYWSSRAASAVPSGTLSFTAAADAKSAALSIYWKDPTAPAAAASNAYQTQIVLVGQ